MSIENNTEFGKWTVISKIKGENYLCKCECGLTKSIPGNILKRGDSKQCRKCQNKGLLRPLKTHLVNQQFGKWFVLERAGISKDKRALWKCRCSCGIEEIVRDNHLKIDNKKCQHQEKRTGIDLFWYHFNYEAKKRKIENTLSLDYLFQLFEIQNKKCALSKVPIILPSQNIKKVWTASVDRIDNTKGYIEGNVQWVHKIVNQMKSSLTIEDFATIVHNLSDNLPNYKTDWYTKNMCPRSNRK